MEKMIKKLTAQQRDLLSLLLDKYERSLTYSGENQVNQSFSVKPAEIYPGYESNYEPVDAVRRFEDEMKQLEKAGLVRIVWRRESISKIVLELKENNGSIFYELLHRSGKNELLREQREFYQRQIQLNADDSPIIDTFCREQLDRIAAGKSSTYELDEAATILNLLRQILANRAAHMEQSHVFPASATGDNRQDRGSLSPTGATRADLLERELSISVFGDSKTFEKSWRSRICRILEKYGDFGKLLEGIDNRREREIVLLEEFGIYANPSYIYVKGRGKITFADGKVIETAADRPIALSSAAVRDIARFEIADRTLMTVENLTSFNRVRRPDTFFLFLSGYHSTLKQQLLLKICRDNGGEAFFHFGDIDPDGFLILRHLREETGIDFKPYRMSAAELKKYKHYCKPLEKNDLTKAQNLLEADQFADEMQYMLDHNAKLEQEIISWMEDFNEV